MSDQIFDNFALIFKTTIDGRIADLAYWHRSNALRRKLRLWKMAGGKVINGEPWAACHYCGTLERLRSLTKDHVFPVSRGGSRRALNNQVLACRTCNLDKGHAVILTEKMIVK